MKIMFEYIQDNPEFKTGLMCAIGMGLSEDEHYNHETNEEEGIITSFDAEIAFHSIVRFLKEYFNENDDLEPNMYSS